MKKILSILILVFIILIILDFNNIEVMELFGSLAAPDSSEEASRYQFGVPSESTPKPGNSLITTSITWPFYYEEPGLTIYKEADQSSNYLFVVDPTQKIVSVQNGWGRLADQWDKAINPVCVFNGSYYESSGTPTSPLIVDGVVVPGQYTEDYSFRMLYITDGRLTVKEIPSNSEVESADAAMSGLEPGGVNGVTNYTVISVKDNLLYVSIIQNRSPSQIVELLTGFGVPEQNIIFLDGGLSSAAECNGEALFVRDRIFANALVISNP